MKKDERMVWRRFNRMGHLFPSSLPPALLLALAACSSGHGAGASITQPAGQDAGSQPQADARTDAGSGSGSGNGTGDGGATAAITDSGNMESEHEAATPATPDAGAPTACVAHGQPCGLTAGSELCCTDGCVNGICGCLSEGSRVTSSSDAAAGACCDGLAEVDGGYCGTSACVPDGTSCQADAGVICCNDNCNGSTCGNL
jgi:hypothetical protein